MAAVEKPAVDKIRDALRHYEDIFEVSVLVMLSAFAGALSLYAQCWFNAGCLKDGLCDSVSGKLGSGTCGFVTLPSLAGDLLYNFDQNATESLLRGVCSPGERLALSAIDGSETCIPHHTWPDALNSEIMDDSASSFHMRASGKWIDAGGSLAQTGATYWSFYDWENTKAAVENAQAEVLKSGRLATSDNAKFYQLCVSTALAGTSSVRASAVEAYEYLAGGLPSGNARVDAMAAVGWLASHACPTAAQLGVTVSSGTWDLAAGRGSGFGSGALASALYVMGEDASLGATAELANDRINARAPFAPAVGIVDFEAAYEYAAGSSAHTQAQLSYASAPELDAVAELADDGRSAELRAYMKGSAAMCALALDSTIDGGIGGVAGTAYEELGSLRAAKPRLAALGQLRAPSGAPLADVAEVINEAATNATTATWAQLDTIAKDTAADKCMSLARYVFPDRFDEMSFDLLMPVELYDRVKNLTEVARAAVAAAVVDVPQFRTALQDHNAVRDAVLDADIQYAGAPRGGYAGIASPLVSAEVSSTDGVMKFAMLQARAIWLDRAVRLGFKRAPTCQGPPIYEALTQNAYIFTADTGACVTMLQGLFSGAFADARFDDKSLASRLVWVAAHEFSHQTLVTNWNTANMNALLWRYQQSVQAEAIADVVAGIALVRAGLVTAKYICMSISQIWAARTPLGYASNSGASHPGPNERADLACETFADLGYAVV